MGSIQVLERTAEKTGSTVKNLCPGLNGNFAPQKRIQCAWAMHGLRLRFVPGFSEVTRIRHHG